MEKFQISASGNNLTANQSYSNSITVCPNVYPNSFLWSNGDTNQTINVYQAHGFIFMYRYFKCRLCLYRII